MLRRTFLGIAAAIVAAPVTIAKALAELPKPVPFVGKGWKVKHTFDTDCGAEPTDLESVVNKAVALYKRKHRDTPTTIFLGPQTHEQLVREMGSTALRAGSVPESPWGFVSMNWHHEGSSIPVLPSQYLLEGQINVVGPPALTEKELSRVMGGFYEKYPDGGQLNTIVIGKEHLHILSDTSKGAARKIAEAEAKAFYA